MTDLGELLAHTREPDDVPLGQYTRAVVELQRARAEVLKLRAELVSARTELDLLRERETT